MLAMTRRHRDAVLGLAPRALARTFLLQEAAGLVREGATADQFDGGPAERARAWVGSMAAARGRRAVGRDDDIPDPIGRPIEVQQVVGETISAAFLPVVAQVASLLGSLSSHCSSG